jgi:uncharacterized membrane protein
VTGTATELLDLVARWIHVIAGIMWVGNSLLFNWLDRNLTTKPEHYGGSGAIWLLHSGGFYYVEKTLLPGQKLPGPLHWFKWQAYTTWVTGLALLIVVYWAGGRAMMADASVMDLTHGQATLIGIGALVGASLIYEIANRLVARHAPTTSMVIWIGALAAIAYGLTQMLSGRAAFLHVGAMLGTIMAGNVFFTIVPSQRALVQSVETGEQRMAVADSARAKRVSIHNNYITFPVLVLMVSSHFPTLYGGPFPFLALLALVAGGALARHALNIRFTSRTWGPLFAAAVIGTIMSLAALGIPRPAGGPQPGSGPVEFPDVKQVIDRRCAVCHSIQPADLAFGPAPGGAAFDTPAQIAGLANRIHERAVVSRTMPPANKTNITEAERALIGRWFTQGAVTR